MNAPPSKTPPKPSVYWAVWAAVAGCLPVFYFVLGRTPSSGQADSFPIGLVAGLPSLVISIVMRWAILPRVTDPAKAFPLFVAGMAMAEGCAIMGLILGGPHRLLLFAAGLVGVLQYIPVFAGRLAYRAATAPITKVIK